MVEQVSSLPLSGHFITNLVGSGRLFLCSGDEFNGDPLRRPFSQIRRQELSILFFCLHNKKGGKKLSFKSVSLAMHRSELWEIFIDMHTYIHTYILASEASPQWGRGGGGGGGGVENFVLQCKSVCGIYICVYIYMCAVRS